MVIQHLDYQHANTHLEAYMAHPDNNLTVLPTVIILHAWAGRDDFVEQSARYYAAQGYVGIALDNYGRGKRGKTAEENARLMHPFMEDRLFLAERLLAGLTAVKALPVVDTKKIIVIGYCFGGLCALDVLRNAAAVAGVISVHGLLDAPTAYIPRYVAQTKVLALTGYNDPLATPEQTAAFAQEMQQAQVDWQLLTFGNTQHAFTNPAAHDQHVGLMYNASAAKRSRIAIDQFILECVN